MQAKKEDYFDILLSSPNEVIEIKKKLTKESNSIEKIVFILQDIKKSEYANVNFILESFTKNTFSPNNGILSEKIGQIIKNYYQKIVDIKQNEIKILDNMLDLLYEALNIKYESNVHHYLSAKHFNKIINSFIPLKEVNEEYTNIYEKYFNKSFFNIVNDPQIKKYDTFKF